MNNPQPASADLRDIAVRAMQARGLLAEFTPAELEELASISGPAPGTDDVRDLRDLPWCSIDNDTSLDLDQLTVAERLDNNRGVRLMVAIADVDALVPLASALDGHACTNTVSVYTPACVFPMLPERLSTDLTSLNPHVDRVALVVEMVVTPQGRIESSDVYRALVHNHARMTYDGVSAWLEGHEQMPAVMRAVPDLGDNLRVQDDAGQRLRALRRKLGALDLETRETRPRVEDGRVVKLEQTTRNRARNMIEDFMIATNGVTARFLGARGYPTLRRVVKEPERWERIRQVALQYGDTLPLQPDASALESFLGRRREADAVRFPDLSLTIVKLLGPGRYAVEEPGGRGAGHFGLAVRDYAHSTAPNRRYPDVITHRLLKAALLGAASPYTVETLDGLADHCTRREDDARKVERQTRKSAAALYLAERLGEVFEALVTGAAPKGTYVRLLDPPAEGRVVRGQRGLDVGDLVVVRLVAVDVEKGFIDFVVAERQG